MTLPPPAVERRDHAIGALLCVLYVALLLLTASDLGLARDESMYVHAAESYAGWFERLFADPGAALTQPVIDHHYRVNHEHPALVKTLFAFAYLADRELSLFTRHSLPFRFVGMLSAGLLLWLVHIFGARLYGRRVGLFAALCMALMPRVFYHAHLDAFDLPITLAVTAVGYCYLRALNSLRWSVLTGLCFGLALSTKHNSWILPGIFAIHFAIAVALDRRRARHVGTGAVPRLGARPDWLIAMVLLGPPMLVGSWPWMWHDTLSRLNAYAAFHLHHDYYNIAYFGENHFWPPFPISFPWVMTLYTVPVTTLLLAAVGLTLVIRGRLAALRDPAADHDPKQPAVLLLGLLLAPLVLISLPSTPIFGGTKHWFTAYPFLAILAGLGFDRLLEVVGAWLGERSARWRRALPALIGSWLLLPAAVETAHSHPFGLSHYGFAAGFVPGSADRGMNRQFWGFTTGSLAPFLYETLPQGGRVYVCDMTHAAFRQLAHDGLLPDNIVPTADLARADLALVHHEHHFAEVDYQIWTSFGSSQPLKVLSYDGVPIISVYANPASGAVSGLKGP
ncbi:MAG: glycosyltransferase family 39 protein [Myxococcales bacterium]|nr:glycosyltransferase family 39 protein [Myxococcales bacterium]